MPFTPEQLGELEAIGAELKAHHTLALGSDKRVIEESQHTDLLHACSASLAELENEELEAKGLHP